MECRLRRGPTEQCRSNPSPGCGNGGTVVLTAANRLHISSIVGTPSGNSQHWQVSATITVQDQNNANVSGVTVSGAWSPTTATSNCAATTTSTSTCTIATGNNVFTSGTQSQTWLASDLALTGYTFDSTVGKTRLVCNWTTSSTGSCTAS